MKKRIIVFVVFSLLCFALVGCVQRDDEAKRSADDAYESSQTAGGDASSDDDVDVFDDDADLGDATDLPETNESEDIGDVDDTSGADGGGYTRNADGSYTWQVGYYELTTTINVWDYIDGDSVDLEGMVNDLGFERVYSITRYKNSTDPAVYLEMTPNSDYTNYILFETYPKDDSRDIITHFTVFYERDYQNEYKFYNTPISFDLIVACAYSCEQLKANPYTIPLEGIIDPYGDAYKLNFD